MPLPNPSMDFEPFEILPAEELDKLVENIESLAAGTGFNTVASFGAYQSTSQSVAVATFTKVALQTEEFDNGSVFDSATNYRFTANSSGPHQFNGAAALSLMADQHRMFVTLYKNGAEIKRGVRTHSSTSDTLSSSVSTVLNLSPGDYVEMFVWQTSGGAKSTVNDVTQTYFNGYKIR